MIPSAFIPNITSTSFLSLPSSRRFSNLKNSSLVSLKRPTVPTSCATPEKNANDNNSNDDDVPPLSQDWRAFRARLVHNEINHLNAFPIPNVIDTDIDASKKPSSKQQQSQSKHPCTSSSSDTTTTTTSTTTTTNATTNTNASSTSSCNDSTTNHNEVKNNQEKSNQALWAHPVSFIEPGSILLSSPRHFTGEYACTFFANTGILILNHDKQTGTVGVILNRPLSVRLKSEKLKQEQQQNPTDIDDLFACDNAPVFLGGPVGLESLAVLHGDPNYGVHVTGAVRSASFTEAFQRFREGRLPNARFFLGYAGWRPGQLETEIQEGVWFIASACDEIVLRQWPSGSQFHRTVLPLMGGFYADITEQMESELNQGLESKSNKKNYSSDSSNSNNINEDIKLQLEQNHGDEDDDDDDNGNNLEESTDTKGDKNMK